MYKAISRQTHQLSNHSNLLLDLSWHLNDSLNAVNRHVMDCLMGHSPQCMGLIPVVKCDVSV